MINQGVRRAAAGAALATTLAVGADAPRLVAPGVALLDRVSGHRTRAVPESRAFAAPAVYLDLPAKQAESVNDSIPLSSAPLERALEFHLPVGLLDRVEREKEVNCLADAIYYEAGNEDQQGQRAVAQVVLNRVRHPAFPNSICAVVFQGSERATGCQFTFTCDGSLARRRWPAAWARAKRTAEAALAGNIEPAVGTATHYHTRWVVPYWALKLDKITVVGAHIFYRWPGRWGRRSAFSASYSPAAPELPTEPIFEAAAEGLAGRGAPSLPASRLVEDERTAPLASAFETARPRIASSRPRVDKSVGRLEADEPKGVLRLDAERLGEPLNLAHRP